jgi:uncharacterized membrane protein
MKARRRARARLTSRERWTLGLIVATLLGIGAAGVWIVVPKPEPEIVLSPGQSARVDLSDIESARPRVFSYPLTADRRVDVFVERSSDSAVTVAFAGCRRCYRAGYYRQDGAIICGRCNERMQRLESGQTPSKEPDCTQIPIPFEQSGKQITIYSRAIGEAFKAWYALMLQQDKNVTPAGSL